MENEFNPCDPELFKEAARQYADLFVSVVSEGCQPCQTFKQKVRSADDITVPIVEISIEQCPEIADLLGIGMMPTVVHMKKGKVEARYENMSPEELVSRMAKGSGSNEKESDQPVSERSQEPGA